MTTNDPFSLDPHLHRAHGVDPQLLDDMTGDDLRKLHGELHHPHSTIDPGHNHTKDN